ncbi:DUF4489 domain-containing protein [Sedimentibacter sp. B4]|uniref:DUF4489 domain-containing protein n=1 Tax=Sedimentibacter sp. B4 TaxID=304766 RepID=UPI0002ECB737|nr:DUF4489 domain-containing protein [Sedimentibacter sp. B4]
MEDRKEGINIRVNGRDKYRYEDSYMNSKCHKPKSIILECGLKPQDAIFEIDDGEVEDDQTFVLDRVIVDATCLVKPIVKIEFSSIVFFEAEAEDGDEHEVKVDLLFKLVRTCNGEKEFIQNWRYLKGYEIENNIEELEVEISEPFTVTFCDKPCSSCCEYKMIVEGKDFEGDFEALRVVKPDLSALAQGQCDD